MASLRRAQPRIQQISTHFAHLSRPSVFSAAPRSLRLQRNMASTFEIPKTMKGVQIEKTGGVEVLQYRTDLPVPTPKEGEILIKNEVSGINFIDTYFRSGLYPSPKPEILGREGSGYAVTTLPARSDIKVGTRVVYMSTGSYAEYTTALAQYVAVVPEHVSLSVACAAFLQGLTALTLIEEAYTAQRGDWILVPAAAGGMGLWLVQLLRARGVHVIATASTEAKRKLARDMGADVVVPYEETLDAVKQHTNGKGVAAVYDGVGKSTFDTSLQAVARKGTVASFGNASGAVEPLAIRRLSEKNVKLCRPTLFNYIAEPEEVEHYSRALWEAIGPEDGKGGPGRVQIEVHKTYPLSEVAQAHLDLEGRKTSGKLLFDPTK